MVNIQESLFVGEKKICTRQDIWHNGGTAAISHTAYCCPVCGEIWGRRIYHSPDIRWRFYERPCEKHGDGSLVFSEYEWEHALYHRDRPEDLRAEELHYPIEWLAYELFLIVRRFP